MYAGAAATCVVKFRLLALFSIDAMVHRSRFRQMRCSIAAVFDRCDGLS